MHQSSKDLTIHVSIQDRAHHCIPICVADFENQGRVTHRWSAVCQISIRIRIEPIRSNHDVDLEIYYARVCPNRIVVSYMIWTGDQRSRGAKFAPASLELSAGEEGDGLVYLVITACQVGRPAYVPVRTQTVWIGALMIIRNSRT